MLQLYRQLLPRSCKPKPWLIHQDETRRHTQQHKTAVKTENRVCPIQTSAKASSHLLNCHHSTRRASGVATLPPTNDATVVTRLHVFRPPPPIDCRPDCLERWPPPPRRSASLPPFWWNPGEWQRPKCLEDEQLILNQDCSLSSTFWEKDFVLDNGLTWTWAQIWTRPAGPTGETLAVPPRLWAKQASPWGSTWKGD